MSALRVYTVTQYDLEEGHVERALMPWTKVYPTFRDAVLALRSDCASQVEDLDLPADEVADTLRAFLADLGLDRPIEELASKDGEWRDWDFRGDWSMPFYRVTECELEVAP